MVENKKQYSGMFIVLITICVAILFSLLSASGMLDRFEFLAIDYQLASISIPPASTLKSVKPLQNVSAAGALNSKKVPEKKYKCDVILIDMPESTVGVGSGPNIKDCAIATKILKLWGAKSVVFADPLPNPTGGEGDTELINAVTLSRGIYLPALYLPALYATGNKSEIWKYTGEPAVWAKEPWPTLLGFTAKVGHVNAFPDIDGRLRQVPVMMQYEGRRIYQLGIIAAMDAMGAKERGVELDPVAHTFSLETSSGELISVPLGKDNQLMIKWKLRNREQIKRVSFRDISESYRMMQYGARPIIDPQIFSGNICIFGTADSNNMSTRPPLVKEGRVTSAACGLVASSILNEDFVYRMPKALDISIILAVTLLFGMALANVNFLRLMIIVVVAIALFSLSAVFNMPQNAAIIVVVLLAIPLGMFIASSQVFSGLIFAALSLVGYYLVSAGVFNSSGLIMPTFCPLAAVVTMFILFYMYTRFKDYLGRSHLFNLASKDGLTGLTNRRYLNMLLDAELDSAALDKTRKLSIVMCDIDNFKKLNDTHGHQAGDAILKNFAKIMKLKCRQADIVARYGGEEFVIIFPGAAAKDALKVAESIRQAIAEEKFIFKGQAYSTSMSMGLAQYENEKTKEDLFEKADQALYRAKEAGKNRVCL